MWIIVEYLVSVLSLNGKALGSGPSLILISLIKKYSPVLALLTLAILLTTSSFNPVKNPICGTDCKSSFKLFVLKECVNVCQEPWVDIVVSSKSNIPQPWYLPETICKFLPVSLNSKEYSPLELTTSLSNASLRVTFLPHNNVTLVRLLFELGINTRPETS